MMSHRDEQTSLPTGKPAPRDAAILLLTFADTTWRMVVPSALLVIAGLWLDRRLGTEPWLTLASVALGLVCSAWLIRAQLRRVT